MIVKTEKLYSFDEAVDILGCSSQRLFELMPLVTVTHQGNRIMFDKESMKKLVLGVEN